MSGRPNCWEFMGCGREPGGAACDDLGPCPAATLRAADGFLGGKNGGRACCYVTGTFCSGAIASTRRDKLKRCEACDFYRHLRDEHGAECTVIRFAQHVRGFEAGCAAQR